MTRNELPSEKARSDRDAIQSLLDDATARLAIVDATRNEIAFDFSLGKSAAIAKMEEFEAIESAAQRSIKTLTLGLAQAEERLREALNREAAAADERIASEINAERESLFTASNEVDDQIDALAEALEKRDTIASDLLRKVSDRARNRCPHESAARAALIATEQASRIAPVIEAAIMHGVGKKWLPFAHSVNLYHARENIAAIDRIRFQPAISYDRSSTVEE